MTPNIQFLIKCCKTNPSASDIEHIRAHLPQLESQQLSKIFTLAHNHGVLPLLNQTLKTHASDLLTSNNLKKIKRQNMTVTLRNMRMTVELIHVMRLLKESGINALAFKGPTLSQLAYGNIRLRQYVDLDILVRKKDIYNVDTLLKNKGYKRILELTSSQEKAWFKYAYDIKLFTPNNGVTLEIHWSLLEQDYPTHINLDTIWENPQFVMINNHEILTFSTENLLLYLCIHGSKHLWERIEWIKDIDQLIQTQDINWEVILKKSGNSDFETMIYLGLYLTYKLFGTEIPQPVKILVTRNKSFVNLTNYIFKRWQNPTMTGISSTIHQTATKLKLFPTLSMRLRYLHKIIFKPTLNEYWFIELPNTLYWLYYLIRPYLLLKKYLSIGKNKFLCR